MRKAIKLSVLGGLILILAVGVAVAKPENPTYCYIANCDGDDQSNWIVGGDGTQTGEIIDQTFKGLARLDQLEGKVGNDIIDGGTGNDYLYGGEDNDQIVGGGGNDYLADKAGAFNGGPDTDVLKGGGDDDVFYTADGDPDDDIYCGQGYDKVVEKDPGEEIRYRDTVNPSRSACEEVAPSVQSATASQTE
jgi:Ca2+-binding RTX toxin-like protein